MREWELMQWPRRSMRGALPHFVWPSALALSAFSGVANAEDTLPNCVLDSDCARGRCIDLVCVDENGNEIPPGPPPSSSPERAPEDAGARPPAPTTGNVAPSPGTTPAERPLPRARTERPRLTPRERSEPRATWTSNSGTEENAPRDEAEKPKRVWYGAPLIATYGATAALGVVTLSSTDFNGGYVAAALFASPTVHWVNGKAGKGFLSLFLQPVAAGIGYAAFHDRYGSNSGFSQAVLGALLSYATWAGIDIGAIAYKDPPKPASTSFGIVPFSGRGVAGAEVVGVW